MKYSTCFPRVIIVGRFLSILSLGIVSAFVLRPLRAAILAFPTRLDSTRLDSTRLNCPSVQQKTLRMTQERTGALKQTLRVFAWFPVVIVLGYIVYAYYVFVVVLSGTAFVFTVHSKLSGQRRPARQSQRRPLHCLLQPDPPLSRSNLPAARFWRSWIHKKHSHADSRGRRGGQAGLFFTTHALLRHRCYARTGCPQSAGDPARGCALLLTLPVPEAPSHTSLFGMWPLCPADGSPLRLAEYLRRLWKLQVLCDFFGTSICRVRLCVWSVAAGDDLAVGE